MSDHKSSNKLSTSYLCATIAIIITIMASTFSLGTVHAADVSGLVAHYTMKEGSGNTTADVTGNGNDGTLKNGTNWDTDRGLVFDGNNDYVNIGAMNGISGQALTISAWFKSSDLDNCSTKYKDCRIISKAKGTSANDHYFMVSTINSSGKTRLRFRLKTNNSTKTLIAGSGDITENKWIHVTAVYDGSKMKLYKDGVLVGSASKSGNINTNSNVSTWIGGNPPKSTSKPWKGHIDDVRIYNKALNEAEIQSMMTNDTGGMLADYPMEEGSGNTTADATGNGNDGTISGAIFASDHGLMFDGSNDYVNIGKMDSISGGTLTISAWFKSSDLANCSYRDCRIISKATGIQSSDHYFMISTVKDGSNTKLRFRLKTNGSTSTLTASSGNLTENKWVHVTAVYDGSNMKLYKDSVLVGSLNKTGSINTNDNIDTWIGGNPSGSKAKPWKGHIDDVKIYGKALSASEVAALFDENMHADTVTPQCSDGIDNDEDGKTDTEDPGCTSANDNDESDEATNTPPVAKNISTTTNENKSVAISLNATDTDGDTLTYSATNPSHGSISGKAPDITYTPNTGYSGSDSFKYKANDGKAESNVATVSITVNALADCGDGLDNDNDGKVDLTDPGCTSANDDDETDPTPSAVCGNDIVETGEVCDGNSQSCISGGYGGFKQCNSQCTGFNACLATEYCGDGTKNGPEECDDGNTASGDGCSAACTIESTPTPKQCNDGIDNDGDGKTDYPADPGCSSTSDDDELDLSTAQCNDGIDNDGDGLVDWQYDLGCYGAEDNTEGGIATGNLDNGWTVFEPSADTKIVYVSNSEGNDDNNGLSPSTPVKTIVKGASLVRDGHNDFLLLKRGDTWTSPGISKFKSGKDKDNPIVIASYGASNERPHIKVSGSFIGHGSQARSHIAVVGLSLIAYTMDPSDPGFAGSGIVKGLRLVGGGSNILIEDNKFRYMQLTIQSHNGYTYSNIKLRRNIVLDAWAPNSTNSKSGKAQGLYASGIRDGLLIEENVFDHNGWNEEVADAGAGMYGHNIYLQKGQDGKNTVARGNIFTRAASHGMQGRSGGLFKDNLFVRNTIGLLIGGSEPLPSSTTTAHALNNVILEGKRMDPNDSTNPQTAAVVGLGIGNTDVGTLIAESNIVAHRIESGINKGIKDQDGAIYIDNIQYDWGGGIGDTTDPGWLDPNRSVGSYHATLGKNGTLEAFLDIIRNRPFRQWPEEYTSYSVNEYIREGFTAQ